MNYNKFLQYIKVIGAYIVRLLLKIFWIFPVKSNKIIFSCHQGNGYTCNPKYLSEYIGKNYKNGFNLIWVFKDIKKHSFLEKRNIKIVKLFSISFFYQFLTSKVIITNSSNFPYMPLRKSQCLINTWHGGGAYKKIGQDRRIYQYRKITTKNIGYMLSSCQAFTQVMSNTIMDSDQKKFWYFGMPRNDIFFQDYSHICKKAREKLGLDDESYKFVLCAPTWRWIYENNEYDLDFCQLKNTLEKKFAGKWKILLRHHTYHNYNCFMEDNNISRDVINVTDYEDMQELLCLADILITDYSSCMWDMSLMDKPCFLYATDVEDYRKTEGFYTPIESWPFPLAQNNKEIQEKILNFNMEKYKQEIKKHHDNLGSYETGEACKKTIQKIYEFCY